ncbi:MAG: glucose 1-dehydrogenase [Burkholderiaceae bacterium]
MNFDNKSVLITGAANGIGRAAAVGFAKKGARLVVVDRDQSALEETASLIRKAGAQVTSVNADVTISKEVQAYVAAATNAYGTIDCFFNNAGIEGNITPTAEYDEAVFDAVIAVNLKGVFLGLRHVLPVMLAQKSGAVVNTASVAGLVGSPGMPAYCASKHAVIGLTKVSAGETASQGIRVNAVCPGPIDTRMIHEIERQVSPDNPDNVSARYQASIPIGRYGTAQEVANVVMFLCSDLAGNVTGAQYVVDGGRTATPAAVTTVS